MNAIIFDTETTDSADGAEIIEAAWIPLRDDAGFIELFTENFEQRYKPSKPITFGAMATHHIIDHELEDCPPSSAFALPDGLDYMIGHQIDFDWRMAGSPANVKRICTLAIARKLWPDTGHTLGALMYMLADDKYAMRDKLRNAHSAMADVYFCSRLLWAISKEAGPFDSLEALWHYSEECRIPEKITFGKHAGTAIKDLPTDYVLWFVRQPDVDPCLLKAFERRLGR
jgi:exodeoxyribonuclease X